MPELNSSIDNCVNALNTIKRFNCDLHRVAAVDRLRLSKPQNNRPRVGESIKADTIRVQVVLLPD